MKELFWNTYQKMLLQLNNLDLEFQKVSNINSQNYKELFPESLLARIALKNNEVLKEQSVAAYFLLNSILNGGYALSLKGLIFTENGKPYFQNGPFISLSHSGEYVCAAVSECPVGVDIEQIREFNSDVLDRFFTKREKRYILKKDTKVRFFTLWTLKEAILKRQGRTISDISKIRLIILGDKVYFKNFKLLTKIHKNYVISVCFNEKTGK